MQLELPIRQYIIDLRGCPGAEQWTVAEALRFLYGARQEGLRQMSGKAKLQLRRLARGLGMKRLEKGLEEELEKAMKSGRGLPDLASFTLLVRLMGWSAGGGWTRW